MAMLMIPGAKVGALIGRKRAFMGRLRHLRLPLVHHRGSQSPGPDAPPSHDLVHLQDERDGDALEVDQPNSSTDASGGRVLEVLRCVGDDGLLPGGVAFPLRWFGTLGELVDHDHR